MTHNRPWMTVRHCRMRLNGIEEVLSDLISKINELHSELEKIVKDNQTSLEDYL